MSPRSIAIAITGETRPFQSRLRAVQLARLLIGIAIGLVVCVPFAGSVDGQRESDPSARADQGRFEFDQSVPPVASWPRPDSRVQPPPDPNRLLPGFDRFEAVWLEALTRAGNEVLRRSAREPAYSQALPVSLRFEPAVRSELRAGADGFVAELWPEIEAELDRAGAYSLRPPEDWRLSMQMNLELVLVSAIDMKAYGLSERHGEAARFLSLAVTAEDNPLRSASDAQLTRFASGQVDPDEATPLPDLVRASPLRIALTRSLDTRAPKGLSVVVRARLVRGSDGWRLAEPPSENFEDDARSLGCEVTYASDFALGTHHKRSTAIAVQAFPRRTGQRGRHLTLLLGHNKHTARIDPETGCARLGDSGPLRLPRAFGFDDRITLQIGTDKPVEFRLPVDLLPWVLVDLTDGGSRVAPARVDTVVFEPALDAVRLTWRIALWNEPQIDKLRFNAFLPGDPDTPGSTLFRYLRNCRLSAQFRVEPCSHPDFEDRTGLAVEAAAEGRRRIRAAIRAASGRAN